LLGSFWSADAYARPVSFKGSTMVMSQSQPMMVTVAADHTPVRWFSFGGTYQWMHRATSHADFLGAELNFLAFRWNEQEWQANAFLTLAAGGLRDRSRPLDFAGLIAAEADAESRHLYVLVSGRYLRGLGGFEDPQLLGRVGVAPFAAEYEEINPWVVLQYQYMPRFSQPNVVTPMLRLLYRSVLLEVGSSLRGEWVINFSAEL